MSKLYNDIAKEMGKIRGVKKEEVKENDGPTNNQSEGPQ